MLQDFCVRSKEEVLTAIINNLCPARMGTHEHVCLMHYDKMPWAPM